MNNWIILVIIYAMFNGFFQCTKKKAVKKTSIYEILFWVSVLTMLLSFISCNNVYNINSNEIFLIILKSFGTAGSWLFSLMALKRMPVGLYSIINLSSVVFSIILSILLLGETISIISIIGVFIVFLGIIFVNKDAINNKKEKIKKSSIFLVLLVAFCNAFNGILDKQIMRTVTAEQLLFWYSYFVTIIFTIVILYKKEKIKFRSCYKNYWIVLTALILFFGDKILFLANQMPNSKVFVMTLVKKLSVIEVIILGKIMFKEKNILKKLAFSLFIILGIVLTII